MGSIIGKEGVKEPKYKVLAKKNEQASYELREYPQFETVGLEMNNGNKGFMTLAKYIGVIGPAQNDQKQKLAMTAPVMTNDIGQESKKVMEFVLPEEINKETNKAPIPNDKSIYVRTEKSQVVGVKSFSWNYKPERGRKQLSGLLEELKRDGLVDKEETLDSVDWKVAQYNSPFTLSFMRRNEVWIAIDKSKIE